MEIKQGQLFQLGPHRLVCGSSENPAHLEALFGKERSDIMITDPPYNVGYSAKAGTIVNDLLPARRYLKMIGDAFDAAFDYCKPGAPAYVFYPAKGDLNFYSICESSGWKVRQALVWVKNHFALSRSNYHWKHEGVLYSNRLGGNPPWYSDRKQTSVLNFPKQLKNPLHPTQKPVALISYLLKNSSQEGDLVFDPFAGSGTCMVACGQMGRAARMIEIDPKYCQVIVERYKKIEGEQ
ncbi:unnamed protein product [Sphagnum tenellum]